MKDGENETYHEWVARQRRENELEAINRRHWFRMKVLAYITAIVVVTFLVARCGGPAPRPPEPMPGVAVPLPPCLDDTDHI